MNMNMNVNDRTIGKKRTYEEVLLNGKEEEKEIEEKEKEKENISINHQQISSIDQKTNKSEFSVDHLKLYYDRLFPYQEVFNWLSYFNDPCRNDDKVNRKYWKNREFSFTLKDDVYVRFKSYNNLNEFREHVRKIVPYKIDIGAIYSIEPNRKSSIPSEKFVPEEKELVFDIDISDYDDVRNCCKEADICNKCWLLMSCAIKVIDRALREDFGFQHLFWVFSGRRGIHCWVCDDLPRKFDTVGRSAIIDYFKLYTGHSQNAIKVDMNTNQLGYIHDSLRRAFDICLPYFKKCSLEFQQIFDKENSINIVCQMIRDETIKNNMKNELLKIIDSNNYEQKFLIFEKIFDDAIHKCKTTRDKLKIESNKMEIVFSYVYPRLDIEVSRHMNHLLKCPFVIHPKSGKVCSIIDPIKCDEFNPNAQPTLLQLIDELDACNEPTSVVGWKNTSLQHIVKTFRDTFLTKLEHAQTQKFKS